MPTSLSELLDLLASGPIALRTVGVIPASSAATASGTDRIAQRGSLAVGVPSSFVGVVDELPDLDRLIASGASTGVLRFHGGRS